MTPENPFPCPTCLHFTGFPSAPGGPVWTCAAFPTEIPAEILSGENPHTEHVDGDQGIRYEPLR